MLSRPLHRTGRVGRRLALLLFVLCTAALRAETSLFTCSKAEYWRYEFVELTYLEKGSSIKGSDFPVLVAKVLKDSQDALSFSGRERIPLFYDAAEKCWRGKWPLFWNISPGDYSAELLNPSLDVAETELYGGPGGNFKVRFDPKKVAASVSFKVRSRQAYDLPPGFCAMTLEPGRASYNAFPGVNGEKPSWFRLLEWAHFMHADAFWQNAGMTHVWTRLSAKNFPWERSHIAMAKLMAPEAKAQGLDFGVYTVTYRVEGNYEKTPYTFTTAYDPSCDLLNQPRYISVVDERRHRDLVALLKELNAVDGVTWLGLDYVRNNNGGLELTDEFLKDMGFKAPRELQDAPLQSRQLWLGRLLARKNDLRLEALWNWFKAHKTCEAVHGILDEAKVNKPVWMFLLGWKQGHQHGQDPFMFIDAGVSVVAPMFYELDPVEFATMLKDWQTYLRRGSGGFVFGQPVDSPLLHNTRNLTGPEELYMRQMEALELLKPLNPDMGFFWHDINRALAGGRGPTSMREWVISGASTFSRLREAAGVVPVHVEILDGVTIDLKSVQFKVKVTNLRAEPIRLLRLDGLPTQGLSAYQPASLDVRNLKGLETRELSWSVSWGERVVKQKYQATAPEIRMLALRARVPDSQQWKRPDFAFRVFGERGNLSSIEAPPTAADREVTP